MSNLPSEETEGMYRPNEQPYTPPADLDIEAFKTHLRANPGPLNTAMLATLEQVQAGVTTLWGQPLIPIESNGPIPQLHFGIRQPNGSIDWAHEQPHCYCPTCVHIREVNQQMATEVDELFMGGNDDQ